VIHLLGRYSNTVSLTLAQLHTYNDGHTSFPISRHALDGLKQTQAFGSLSAMCVVDNNG
jgi:hypothetical protein